MKKKHRVSIWIFLATWLVASLVNISEVAAANGSSGGGGTDWFSIILVVGYLGGVFVLLPIVIYTNLTESVFSPTEDNQDKIVIDPELTEEKRNSRAAEILERIAEKLTPVKGENDEDLITITKGSQAKFTKRGLDYIKKHLDPTDEDVLNRMNELEDVYNERTKRVFSGSKWIIACSVAVALLFVYTAGFSSFLVIHLLGLLFYILSSRTTIYGLEKRMEWFGGANSGIVASVFAGLFSGMATNYYVKYSDGTTELDGESTMSNMAITTMFIIFVALILGFMAVVLGVINFLLNYSTSFLLPFKKDQQWYEENFSLETDGNLETAMQ